jgi:predicted tellurium resistance membrane protein TerC
MSLVERYPPLVDAAFIIIAWVGIKLFVEFVHVEGYIAFEFPRWLSLGLIVVIFVAAFLYARTQERRGRLTGTELAARRLLEEEEASR